MAMAIILIVTIKKPKGGENRGQANIDELLEQASGKQISS